MSENTSEIPTFTTTRLTLRRLSHADAGAILLLRSDPEINKYLDRKPSRTLEDARNFIDGIRSSAAGGLFYWAVTRTGEESLIGTICLFGFSGDAKKCEIGYELLTEFQGKGYMLEAAKAVLAFGRDSLGLQSVAAVTHRDNERSTGILLKLGFKESGGADGNPDLVSFRFDE